MRTTIELDDANLIRLKKLAVERGDKGFSALVNEAVAAFLAESDESADLARRARQIDAIYAVAGTISEAEADAMLESVRESRRNWREPWSTLTS